MKYIIIMIALVLTGCNGSSSPKEHYNYTIWVGSSVVSVGYDTDSYSETNTGVRFTTKKGKEKIVPYQSLVSIDVNKEGK